MKIAAISMLLIILLACLIGQSSALPGQADIDTFMYKSYEGNPAWCSPFDNSQWGNWDDWNGEMHDIAACYGIKNSQNLMGWFGIGGAGHNYDLIAIQTHGRETGSGSSFQGKFSSYLVGDRLESWNIEPADSEPEIYLLQGCDAFPENTYEAWYGYRNLYRRGALIAAGNHGLCTVQDTGLDSTWNRIGDNIADEENSIKRAWFQGHTVWYSDDHVIIFAIGDTNTGSCDYRSRTITFQNKGAWVEYTYPRNYPYNQDYEVCGYMSVK